MSYYKSKMSHCGWRVRSSQLVRLGLAGSRQHGPCGMSAGRSAGEVALRGVEAGLLLDAAADEVVHVVHVIVLLQARHPELAPARTGKIKLLNYLT